MVAWVVAVFRHGQLRPCRRHQYPCERSSRDGSDLDAFLQQLFLTLNTPAKARGKTLPHLAGFPYVNGGLFSDTLSSHSVIPTFSTKSRQKLIELGMHYTSVPNIMKVIKALFLDDLYEDLEKSKGSKPKLEKLLSRLYRLRIFDPACGSGNFLILAYKELRRLEMAVFCELAKGKPQASLRLPGINVSQFYGIELDDFAHEVAILALWLAEHQMNLEFKAAFGNAPAALPLKDGAKIVCGNALQLDWEKVCPQAESHEVFVLGNPPDLGSSMQELSHKQDMAAVFQGIKDFKNLDYIACWFLQAARYLRGITAACAFVRTEGQVFCESSCFKTGVEREEG